MTSTITGTNTGTAVNAGTADPEALFAYSSLIAEGGSVQELEKEVKKEVVKRKVPKMSE